MFLPLKRQNGNKMVDTYDVNVVIIYHHPTHLTGVTRCGFNHFKVRDAGQLLGAAFLAVDVIPIPEVIFIGDD